MQRLDAGNAGGAGKVQDNNDATLFDRFAPTLFTYLYQQVASQQDAEDLLLEVFLAAFHQGKLAGQSAERQLAWLRRVARNKVIDRYRRTSLLTMLPLEHIAEQEDDTLTPEQRAEQQERYTRLYEAIQRLSPVQQELIRLRYVCDMRLLDIAALLDRPEGTVRKMLTRTLRQLRNLYEQQERGM